MTERPWERVGADILDHDSGIYLILSDYYSNYFELTKLSTKSSQNVINICKN